jgi:hypothetical protein
LDFVAYGAAALPACAAAALINPVRDHSLFVAFPYRYDQLSTYILGQKRGKAVLLPFQLAVLLGMAITYTVVSMLLLLLWRRRLLIVCKHTLAASCCDHG